MKLNRILPVAFLMLAVTACQNDDEPSFGYLSDPEAVSVNPTISGLQSRVNTLANGDKWTQNDKIKVEMTSEDAVEGKNTAVYAYDSSWKLQGSSYIVWPSHKSTKSYTFQAFYPYQGNNGTSFSNFVLPSNQSSATAGENFIGNADWMVANTSSVKVEKVNLSFIHQLVKLSVKIIAYGEQYKESLPTISEPTFLVPTTRTAISGKTVSVQGSATTIQGLMETDKSDKKMHTFTAVVMPGKYTANDNFLTLKINGDVVKVKVGSNQKLTQGLVSGKAYTFGLTIGKGGLSIGSVTVNDWGASDWGEGEHGGIADEVK